MTTRNGPPGYVANQFPSICRAGLIGGAGGCTGAGGSVGIEGPLLCWNDCELHPATRHASTIASDVNARRREFDALAPMMAVDERGRLILILIPARGIGSPRVDDSRGATRRSAQHSKTLVRASYLWNS